MAGNEFDQALQMMERVGVDPTISGADYREMASAFTMIAATGMVRMDLVERLRAVGVPALQLIARERGVTDAEATALVRSGEITSGMFQDALKPSSDRS